MELKCRWWPPREGRGRAPPRGRAEPLPSEYQEKERIKISKDPEDDQDEDTYEHYEATVDFDTGRPNAASS